MSEINKIKIGSDLYGISDDTARQQIQNLKNSVSSGEDTSDYTAFEVFAHDYDMAVGEFSLTIDGQTFTNKNAITASNTHIITFRTMNPDYSNCDIVIDWGDGTVESVKKQDFLAIDNEFADNSFDTENGEYNYTFKHDYANGKYIVKIYGKDYYSIYQKSVHDGTQNYQSLLCRAFGDLPLANHFNSITFFCARSPRLLYLNADSIKYKYIINAAALASYCENLVKAVGFKRNFTVANCEAIFSCCTSLETADAQLPLKSVYKSACREMYNGCISLTTDINKFFPDIITSAGEFNMQVTFGHCVSLTGTVPADKLWNSKTVTWTNTSSAFAVQASYADLDKKIVRSQVPISWGGLASNDIIEKSDAEKITELESTVTTLTERIVALETYIQNNPSISEDTLVFEQ